MTAVLGTSPDSVLDLHAVSDRRSGSGPGRHELRHRAEAVQALMTQAGIDCLLITNAANFYYFTGVRSSFWHSPTRSFFLLVPAEHGGRLRALVPSIMAPALKNTVLGKEGTVVAREPTPGATDLDALLAEITRGRPKGTLGVMKGFEATLRMPIKDYETLDAMLSRNGWTTCDASGLVRELRNIKSRWEQTMLATACRIASDAFAVLPQALDKLLVRSSELTEKDVQKAMRLLLLELGADEAPYVLVQKGMGGYTNIVLEASDNVLVPGDVVIVDVGCIVNGYWADFDRNFIVGGVEHLTDEVRYANSVLWDATEAGFEAACRQGSAGSVWRAMQAVLSAALPARDFSTGRMGHGLGLSLTEHFSVTESDNTPLVPGMVMTLEPGAALSEDRLLVHEENILITESGAAWLSTRAPKDIPPVCVGLKPTHHP